MLFLVERSQTLKSANMVGRVVRVTSSGTRILPTSHRPCEFDGSEEH